ncbi:hypothetical protein FN976_08720 [Caenimonas sedimenti]|uniref:SCP domain-containing protein n=1 Tax=Caenimonas sedimenti TaxID=2596921 RepID=A0A562ZTT1_9BURK|nr:CvpA family protein [Caenimonas sedimenti]TWO71685.1 hypothetical protein FN976_08720 [Caenimonas sedimenti]
MDPLTFSLIDVLLVLVILLGTFAGWRRGFLIASLDLLVLIAGVVVAFLFYQAPAAWLGRQVPTLAAWTLPLSFLGILVFTWLLLGSIGLALARSAPPKVHVHGINRFFGLLPGLGNGLINATVAALILHTVPLGAQLAAMTRASTLASTLASPAEWLEARLTPIFDPAVRRLMQVVTVPAESHETIALKSTVADPKVRPDLEARMLAMVNAERERAGLKPVQADPELAEVARAHSRDMFARGYFSHVTPEKKSLGDRIRQRNVRYLVAGENLAMAQTLNIAHDGLMKSPGHRANILRPQFGRLGIGVLDGGRDGLMVTQNFRN